MRGRCSVDAIARVDGNGTRGTGFLVRAVDGRLLVLTAGHVADFPPLTVTFAANGFSSPATVEHRDPHDPASPLLRGTADWAALACTAPVPGEIDPIELDDLDGLPATPFETFGYPNLYGWPGNGGPMHGMLRRAANGAIQPFCNELDGKAADLAAGISGAPCLVADVAIGLVNAVLAIGDTVVGGSLLVVPASTIAGESGGALALSTDPGLPYLAETQRPLEALNDGMLQDMVNALELAPVAGQHLQALRRRVARGLLLAQPDNVAHALVSVKEERSIREAAAHVVVRRESLGIPSTTVQGALRLLDSGGTVAFDATLEVSARLLLRRVSRVRGNGTRWYMPKFCLVVNPAADNDAAVVSAVRSEAAAIFPGSDPDKLLNERVMFAAIFRTLPRPTTRNALTKAFKLLRVMFCSDRPTDLTAPDLGAVWLAAFTADYEHTWRSTCLGARDHLRDNAVTALNDDQLDRMD